MNDIQGQEVNSREREKYVSQIAKFIKSESLERVINTPIAEFQGKTSLDMINAGRGTELLEFLKPDYSGVA